MVPATAPYGDGPLPIVLGPQHDHFDQETLTLTQGDYVVTNDYDRMGTRFDGQPLPHIGDFNIVSDAMAAGSVQIPGGQTPIIMGPDRGTVGGYTKIGTVATVAMSRFGRLKPGPCSVCRHVGPDAGRPARERGRYSTHAMWFRPTRYGHEPRRALI